jgi:hexosaminidase
MNRAAVAVTSLALSLTATQARAQAAAPYADVAVSWAVVDNIYGAGHRFLLTLENTGDRPLPASGWELYFNMLGTVDSASAPPSIRVTHVNGDFHRLRPTDAFQVLAAGERLVLPLSAGGSAIKAAEAPRGFYFVVNGSPIPVGEVRVAPFVNAAQTMRSPRDRLAAPTAASRYADNAGLTVLDASAVGRILPTPVRFAAMDGSWTLDSAATIAHQEGLEGEAAHLADALAQVTGARPRAPQALTRSVGQDERSAIVLRTDPSLAAEGYTLTVDPARGVEIVGGDAAGVFYGVQSFRALLPVEAYAAPQRRIDVPAARVEDAPGLRHRGMHLDVARNFQPAESVERLLDLMAFYKLNRFHFHLTDDEGWRLGLAALPELTAVGGRRGHTADERDHLPPAYGSGPSPHAPPGSGHYTREQFVALLRRATERHIEVIPEIDLPGHARAAIKAMESRYHRLSAQGQEQAASAFRLRDPDDRSEYRSVQGYDDNVANVCLESTYRLIEAVVDELVSAYRAADAPLNLVHIGGDEVPHGVWERSPACQALIAREPAVNGVPELFHYFLRRTAAILGERGLALAGWEEIALTSQTHSPGPKEPNRDFVGSGFVPFVWNAVWGWGAEDLGYRLANAGYEVVLSNAGNLYFDLAYDKDPEEPGFYWAGFIDTRMAWEFLPFDLFRTARRDLAGNPIDESRYADAARPTEAGRSNIRGLQGQLWSETLVEPWRMEYMAYPRLLPLAERAWAPEPAWSRIDDPTQREPALMTAWNEFANRLAQRELPRLDHLLGGVGYRIPVPGAVVRDGMLHANVEYPGMTIRYTTDGSTPTAQSPRYTEPVPVDGPVMLRVFDTRGRGGRSVVAHVGRDYSRVDRDSGRGSARDR